METLHDKFRDACEKGNLRVSKSLIKNVLQHSPNELMPMISSYHYHSLRWACKNGHLEVVELLIDTVLQHSPDDLMPMIRSADDYYSLCWACFNG